MKIRTEFFFWLALFFITLFGQFYSAITMDVDVSPIAAPFVLIGFSLVNTISIVVIWLGPGQPRPTR